MTKEEMIDLLKSYKVNVAKLKLKEKNLKYYQKILDKPYDIEIGYSSNKDENSGIKSKNRINDNVGNIVVNTITKSQERKENLKIKIHDLELEIAELQDKVEEAEIRLNCLYYKEKEILIAYYVENRTADDIAENLFFRLFNRKCSKDNVYKIITSATNIMLKL